MQKSECTSQLEDSSLYTAVPGDTGVGQLLSKQAILVKCASSTGQTDISIGCKSFTRNIGTR